MATHKDRILLNKGQEVDGYTIISLLGQGGFGDVYKVVDSDGKEFAMKTEYLNAPKRALKAEVNIMKKLSGPCFPKVYADGETEALYYLVMELLGPSISDIRRAHQNFIGSEFTYNFALHSLDVIHQFHECGYIHRDIKPSNFLINRNQVYPLMLIDFGLSKPYIDFETGRILPPGNGHYIGTKKYASLNAHRKNDLGRCDDLYSWFYALIEMKKGRLPWRNVRELEDVAKMKEKQTDLLIKPYPELTKIYNYLNKLNFEDEPDYEYLKSIISNEMIGKGYYPENFNWISFYDNETNEEEEEDSNEIFENKGNKENRNIKENREEKESNENKEDSDDHGKNTEPNNIGAINNSNIHSNNESNDQEDQPKQNKSKKHHKNKKNHKHKKAKKTKKSKKTKNRDIDGNDDDSTVDSDGKCCLIS